MNDSEKSEEGYKTIIGFFQQFGDDIYAQILLEELFKGLINEETLFIFGEQEQAGNQTGDSSSESIDNNIETDGFVDAGSSDNLAEEDLTDYP